MGLKLDEKIRDYKHEHEIRKFKKTRFIFELDIKKGNELKEYLKENNLTLTKWIKDQIKEIGDVEQ